MEIILYVKNLYQVFLMSPVNFVPQPYSQRHLQTLKKSIKTTIIAHFTYMLATISVKIIMN
jgi:hypothetical protein